MAPILGRHFILPTNLGKILLKKSIRNDRKKVLLFVIYRGEYRKLSKVNTKIHKCLWITLYKKFEIGVENTANSSVLDIQKWKFKNLYNRGRVKKTKILQQILYAFFTVFWHKKMHTFFVFF